MISPALFGLAAAAAPIQRYQKAQVVVGTSVLAMAVVAGWFEGALALEAAAAIGLLCVLCGYLARVGSRNYLALDGGLRSCVCPWFALGPRLQQPAASGPADGIRCRSKFRAIRWLR